MTADVISLDEARNRLRMQPELVAQAEFFRGMYLLREALELIEALPGKRAEDAYDRLCQGMRVVFDRERRLGRG
ncbi:MULTISPECIES: hypothetical protein [Brucella]|uniref:hypothetical protein n=1 Tax=unclassified Brucella TaxID=2632610 RepID=UPI000972B243|nr:MULTISPECIES: hypothetical protein [unclassified Brucella]APX68592.1 hypothetical protein BKD03_04055 [Brucella sp. 09RB8471]MRN77610.1 hypothetical protein [Brucella sp. 10RB9210]